MSLIVAASAPFAAITDIAARMSRSRVFCFCRVDRLGRWVTPALSDISGLRRRRVERICRSRRRVILTSISRFENVWVRKSAEDASRRGLVFRLRQLYSDGHA